MTPYYDDGRATLYVGHVLAVLAGLEAGSVQTCITSPPYWGLRAYGTDPQVWGGDPTCAHVWAFGLVRGTSGGTASLKVQIKGEANFQIVPDREQATCDRCGAWRGELGSEPTPEQYVANIVAVFRAVRRVLRDDGTLWLNLGDSYAGSGKGPTGHNGIGDQERRQGWGGGPNSGLYRSHALASTGQVPPGLKAKDLVGIPWRVAFALQADGWYLRSDIIWCLSGGTRVYARTQKGEMPMTVTELTRLNPATVQLWNGAQWTQALGWNQSPLPEDDLEILLRSGERISCTPGHQWPTARGLVRADDLRVGDVLESCRLPAPAPPRQPALLPDAEIGWLVGLYIAEGSRSGDTVQIASHADDHERVRKLERLAQSLDGTCARHWTGGNAATINLHGPVVVGAIDAYVTDRTAYRKHLSPRCWGRSDAFLKAVLLGYLEGDGHFDGYNQRWRLGFTENDALAADLRTLCARLGIGLRLHRTFHQMLGRRFPGYRGEVRFERSGHHNEKPDTEVVAINYGRGRTFWDIGVADEPHTFALASGVLTHNSKPNPMPESVTDRPTKAHEYLFLLSKRADYYYDMEATKEPISPKTLTVHTTPRKGNGTESTGEKLNLWMAEHGGRYHPAARNRRSVWVIPTEAYPAAHFACVDADTECLTINGWQRHETLAPGTLAAQYDTGTGLLSWAPIEAVARYEVTDQPMVVAQSRDVQFWLTPNHRTLVQRRHQTSRDWKAVTEIRADELKPSHAIPVSASWEEGDETPFDDDWAELLGWYLAEGCETVASWAVEIYQSKSANPAKVDRIRALLVAVGAEFREATAARTWRGQPSSLTAFRIQGYAAIALRQWAPGKQFHPDTLRWSTPTLIRLLVGLIDGDGHRRPDGRSTFIQRSRDGAGMAQAIGMRLGYATMLTRRSEGTYTVYFTRKRQISLRGTGGEGAQINQQPYTGVIWCPSLPAGTWVARRNGRAFITGNTFPRKLVEPCVLAGTSARGCCSACGAPWRRVVAREPAPPEVFTGRGAPTDGFVHSGSDVNGEMRGHGGKLQAWRDEHPPQTTGWEPTCTCAAGDPVPQTVLDPFAGSGTTLAVARWHQRRAVGIELNPEYARLIEQRLAQGVLL